VSIWVLLWMVIWVLHHYLVVHEYFPGFGSYITWTLALTSIVAWFFAHYTNPGQVGTPGRCKLPTSNSSNRRSYELAIDINKEPSPSDEQSILDKMTSYMDHVSFLWLAYIIGNSLTAIGNSIIVTLNPYRVYTHTDHHFPVFFRVG
jgi:hypothetical protein